MIELLPHEEIATALLPGWTANGEAADILVAKASFSYDAGGQITPVTADPVLMADSYPNDDPEQEAPAAGIEAVPFKQGAEWWLVGSAYSDEPRPFFPVEVRLTTGDGVRREKKRVVFGNRHWKKTWRGWVPGEATPITRQSLGYEATYGGRHPSIETDVLMANPVGLGYGGQRKRPSPEQIPLPNLEAIDHLISRPHQRSEPAGMGPIPSHWHPRASDFTSLDIEALMRGDCPYSKPLPPTAYHSAPADQWLDKPLTGRCSIDLKGLTPGVPVGNTVALTLDIPALQAVMYTRTGQARTDLCADTLIIDTDQCQLHLLYRHAVLNKGARRQAELVVRASNALAVPGEVSHG